MPWQRLIFQRRVLHRAERGALGSGHSPGFRHLVATTRTFRTRAAAGGVRVRSTRCAGSICISSRASRTISNRDLSTGAHRPELAVWRQCLFTGLRRTSWWAWKPSQIRTVILDKTCASTTTMIWRWLIYFSATLGWRPARWGQRGGDDQFQRSRSAPQQGLLRRRHVARARGSRRPGLAPRREVMRQKDRYSSRTWWPCPWAARWSSRIST